MEAVRSRSSDTPSLLRVHWMDGLMHVMEQHAGMPAHVLDSTVNWPWHSRQR